MAKPTGEHNTKRSCPQHKRERYKHSEATDGVRQETLFTDDLRPPVARRFCDPYRILQLKFAIIP